MARGRVPRAETQRRRGVAACPHAAEGGVLATKNAKSAKAMKPSGVAWLGDIPDGWELRRGKYLLSQISEPSSSQNKVALENIESGTGKYIDSNAILQGNGIAFTQGDILYGKLRPYLAKVWLAEFEGNAVGDFFVYRVATAYYNCYAKYVMLAPSFTAITNDSTYGAKMPRVSAEFIANLRFPLPPLPEQRAIADYLDKKCGAIDAAIAEAKKGIEEYKAWKKSLIFEAVNGEWKKRRLRFLADITTGNKDTQDAEPEGAYPFYVRSPIVERSSSYTFEGPGILMAGDGAGAGRVFHYAEGKYAVHQRVYRIYNFRGIEGRFLLYSLGAIFPLEMDKGSAQSTVPSVRLPMLKDLPIPLPPLPEQQAIADYLDEKCAAIDAMVAEKEALIADLEAYKKSLIYEVVTGKREVA